MMIRLAERELTTRFGVFREVLYYDGQTEAIALMVGNLTASEGVLCRIHSSCLSGHVFNSIECECATEMAASQAAIQKAGRGVIIYLDQEGKGNGHLALMESIPFKKAGMSQGEAYVKAGYKEDARDYRPAAEILQHLGVDSVVLLTGNRDKADELKRFGIEVTGTENPLLEPDRGIE